MSQSEAVLSTTTVVQPEFFAPWHVRLGSGEISPRRLLLLQAMMLREVLAKLLSKSVLLTRRLGMPSMR